ncbi:MAG: imm11 family protein [Chitinophagaceae bacterium]
MYKIRNSLNHKEIGVYPQIETGNYPIMYENSNFIGNIHLKKITSHPDLTIPILRKKAKLTDLISAGIMGFSFKLLISTKLKLLLEKYQNDNLQFFKTSLIYKDDENNDYWVVHPYRADYDFVDYAKSVISKENILGTDPKEYVTINSTESFIQQRTEHRTDGKIWGFTIEKIAFKNGLTDLFVLDGVSGGIGYYVSEKLKNEIEEAGCTGIEFEPVEQA